MTQEPTDERLGRLRVARDRIEAQLADPRTPPYSIAPLSNQIRLVDKAITELLKPEQEGDGLPSTATGAGWLDFMQFRAFVRRGHGFAHPPRTVWAGRQRGIFEAWLSAGFRVPDRFDGEDAAAWGERCRSELTCCLDPRGADL